MSPSGTSAITQISEWSASRNATSPALKPCPSIDIALKNHAIDGRANDEGVWHVALALDLIDKVRRHTEVLQATRRTDNASRGLRPRWRRYIVTDPARVLLDKQTCCLIEDLLTEDRREHVALFDMRSAGRRRRR